LQETTTGRDLQLPIYLLAAEHLIEPGQSVEWAAFFYLGKGVPGPPLTRQDRAATLQMMRERIAEVVSGVRSGYFAVQPRDKCPPYCAFATICRLNLDKRDTLNSDLPDQAR
jgi:hypothetical protein